MDLEEWVPGPDELADFEDAIDQLDDPEPTDGQRHFMQRSDSVLIKERKHNPGDDLPPDMNPDDIGGTRLNIVSSMDVDERREFGLNITGLNDEILRAAFDKPSLRLMAFGDKKEWADALEAAFMEAAAIKQRNEKSKPQPVTKKATALKVPPQLQAPTPPQPSPALADSAPVDVTFDYGDGDVTYARFSKVFIHGFVMVLVVGENDRWRGVTMPRIDKPMTVTVTGLDQPVAAVYAGVTFPYAGDALCILFVDRQDG